MFEYDIWVLSKRCVPSIMMAISKDSDFEAIETARDFAGDRPFEVWGDQGCVYRAHEAFV